jgi:hypothetical protein
MLPVAAAGIAVVLGASALGLAAAREDGRPSAATTTTATTTTSTTAAPAPSTTQPARTTPVLQAVDFDGETARYLLADADAVTVVAHEPCWVSARRAPGDTELWQATLAAGETRTVPFEGSLWLRLGNPGGVSLRAGAAAVELPGPDDVPVNVELSTST